MRKITFFAAATVAALVIVLAARPGGGDAPPAETAAAVPSGRGAAPQAAPSAEAASVAASVPVAPAAPAPAPPPAPLGSGEVPAFKTTERGELMLSPETRDGLERVLALNDPQEALALLRSLAATMPPIAHRQLMDAALNFRNYQTALTRAFPPGQVPADAAEALQQLDALHALRVQQLGPEVAAAYFAAEEAQSRELIAAMQAQNEPSKPPASAPGGR